MPADSREAPKSIVLLCSQIAIVLDGSCLRLQKTCVERVVVFFFYHHKDKWGGGHAEMFKISLLRSYSITQPVTLLLTLGRDYGELQGHCSLASDGPGKTQIVLT